MHFPKGGQSPDWVFSEHEEASVEKDLSLTHCKVHDCHLMLTVFLPIAIRAIKLEFLKMAITRMCYFFLKISQKMIHKEELSDLMILWWRLRTN
jgi:hypothetical protein